MGDRLLFGVAYVQLRWRGNRAIFICAFLAECAPAKSAASYIAM
jgi:hypothetical protein